MRFFELGWSLFHWPTTQDFEEAGLHQAHQRALHLSVKVAFELIANYSRLLAGEADLVEAALEVVAVIVDAS